MWKFLVKNQKIEVIDREVIASDQIQFVNLKFIFDGQWKELHKVVQFTQCDETYNRVLGNDGLSCLLPAELHAGTVMMSIFGYETDNVQALRATTVPVILHIRQSGFVGDDINVPPTPDLYQQLLAEIKNGGTGSGQNGVDGKDGKDGADGLSAYEIAVQEGFVGSVSEWLESLKGEDGKDGVNGVDGKNGTDGKDGINGRDGTNGIDGKDGINGTDGADGLSAYELAIQNGYAGSVSEWLASLKGKDGKDGINGRDGTNGIDGKDGHDGVNGVDGRDGKNGLSAYEIAVNNGFSGSEADWLESLKGLNGFHGRDGTNGYSAYELAVKNGFIGTEQEWLDSLHSAPDLTEINADLSEFQQIIDELKYNSELYEERISYLERNANCQSQIVFRYGSTVPGTYADGIYTFYNDGYRNLSGFTQTYPNFCSADNDYALYINQTDFGWGGAVYVMFITPIQVKQSSQLSVTYLSGATDNAEFYLIERNSEITSKSDLARYIYDKIESYDCEKVAFKWLQSGDYITQLIDLSKFPSGNYYLAFKGISDNTHPKIKEIKVRED